MNYKPGTNPATGSASVPHEYSATAIGEIKSCLIYCPTCGNRLEHHPFDEMRVSCYRHGDFVIVYDKSTGQIQTTWQFMQILSSDNARLEDHQPKEN